MKTYLRDEFATAQRIKELESLNTQLLQALKAIAGMKISAATNHEQLTGLCVAIATTAITKAQDQE